MKDQLQPGEEVVAVARPTKVTLVPIIVLLVLLLVGLVPAARTESNAIFVVVALMVLVTALRLLQKLIVMSSYEYVLTNRRVVRQLGILNRSSIDSYLDKINNVEHRQNLWGRVLGYGDVIIDTASETGMTIFPMISNPLGFKNAVIGAMESYRATRMGYGVPPPVAQSASPATKMRELKALLDEGLISNEEYEMKRKKLLEEM